jgi:hypothetical protein
MLQKIRVLSIPVQEFLVSTRESCSLRQKRLSLLRCPHPYLRGEQRALCSFPEGKEHHPVVHGDLIFMKSTKTMLLGTIIVLLGIGLIQSGNDQYLTQTFPFLGGNTMTAVFPLVSLALILLGALIGVVGVFVRK